VLFWPWEIRLGFQIRSVMGFARLPLVKTSVGEGFGQMGLGSTAQRCPLSNRARDSQQPLGGPGAEAAAA